MRPKIGIVGMGIVGTPVKRWFEEEHKYQRGKDLFLYDTDPKKGFYDDVNKADIVIICVPTPPNPNGSCNTKIVESVVASLRPGAVIAIKSTVPPGTTARLQAKYPDKSFLFWPEFLTERRAWEDFTGKCGRQIVAHTGENIHDAYELARLLPLVAYMSPWRGNYYEKECNATEAELAKYFANIFGALKVTLANFFYDVCEALVNSNLYSGVEGAPRYGKVRELVGADSRINDNWLDVLHGDYRGFGGYCFPKDLEAFIVFVKDLLTIVSDKNETADLRRNLSNGVKILEAVQLYNRELLKSQGLSVEDVSCHDSDFKVNV